MTTLAYTIQLTDSERITLDAALELLGKECDMQIANSHTAPYVAHLASIASIQNKLSMGAQPVSGNTFGSSTN